MNLWTEKLDARIEAEYAKHVRGTCKRLSKELGISTSYISFRARVLGCRSLRASSERERPWSKEEDRVLIDHGHEPAKLLVRRFARRGRPGRTQDMIYRRAAFLVNRGEMDPLGVPRDGLYSPDDICSAMGVCRRTFGKWVNSGVLKAERKGDSRVYVKLRDLRRFLIDGIILYDPGRCDKFWLVDVLAGELRSKGESRAGYLPSSGRGQAETARLLIDVA